MSEYSLRPLGERDGKSARQMEIMAAIGRERKFQDGKYGVDGHELGTWLIVIEKELNEAKAAATGSGRLITGRNSVRAEILQIAAVCVAALEQHGLEEGS